MRILCSIAFGILRATSLEVASATALDETQVQVALKQAIATQAGVELAEVTSLQIVTKVAGTVPLEVVDPEAFIADEVAVTALKNALASVNNVTADAVEVLLEAIVRRRLADEETGARRLAANVQVAYEFVAADGAAADASTEAMMAAPMLESLASAINMELADSDLEVTSVEEIMAAPTVEITYTIETDDATAAADAISLAQAEPAIMATAINDQLDSLGVDFQVTGVAAMSTPSQASSVASTSAPQAALTTASGAPRGTRIPGTGGAAAALLVITLTTLRA